MFITQNTKMLTFINLLIIIRVAQLELQFQSERHARFLVLYTNKQRERERMKPC